MSWGENRCGCSAAAALCSQTFVVTNIFSTINLKWVYQLSYLVTLLPNC